MPNQSALLAGVHDSAAALVTLSERLLSAGALPHCIVLLNRVRGAVHFEVDHVRARKILVEVATRLPGHRAPQLVRAVTGKPLQPSVVAGWPGP